MILLFLFPVQCLEAGKKGLMLWFNIIIPTLFPFILISNLLIYMPLLNHFNPAAYVFLMGSLSGYPMGAKAAADMTGRGRMTQQEGNMLLLYCNNASPMFILGYVCTSLLKAPTLFLPMLAALYVGNFINLFMMTRAMKRNKKNKRGRSLTCTPYSLNHQALSFSFFDDCIMKTAELLVKIGGYIIFTSIPITLLASMKLTHPIYLYAISLIELSNGCALISSMAVPMELKFALLCALVSFGSLSVLGQTGSLIKNTLSMKTYALGKVMNGVISFFTGWISYQLFDLLNDLLG